MRKLNDAISRFCANHPYWGIPNLMRYVVIGTVIMSMPRLWQMAKCLS